MSDILVLADARARGIALPEDDVVAQAILDDEEAWLAQRIGQLTGDRTETFYVGVATSHGKLGLARYTDEIAVTDGSNLVDADHYRLVDNGGGFHRTYAAPAYWWTGPYVSVTYEPNDLGAVRKALYRLLELTVDESEGDSGMASESIGDYSYSRGQGSQSVGTQRAALVASLLPKRDPLTTLYAVSRRIGYGDPVINRPEPPL